MKVILANPRGFCAGVDRAISIVNLALDLFGAPIYVRHEVVHNRFVVAQLRQRGAIFIEELEEVPEGATLIFSAHGVPKSVREAAEARNLQLFDATCPLVGKVHMEVARFCREGMSVVLIGHRGHAEVEGTLGQWVPGQGDIFLVENAKDVAGLKVRDPDKLAFVTQTTLSIDDSNVVIAALQERFPNIKGPRKSDICYATQNRQDAVRSISAQCDVLIVVGSPNSSNSNRLRELAEKQGCHAYLVDSAEDLKQEWLVGNPRIGMTAGASAPEVLVEAIANQLKAWGVTTIEEVGDQDENMVFPLPRELTARAKGESA